ncbi:protocadherin alpha-5 isoform X30 [Xyrichtys novacula]|uniref:Protocadherin alpha-5 isoform X30 n=1 Tax=Xyrichtys novacula TaxID=13765 RepID=A0AAV1FDA8_XYRNO|nr:protocadherin alpha-5 isoform X30 [Xyrichtys novacula]
MARTDVKERRLDMCISLCLALVILADFEGIAAQIRYSIQEESKLGSPVGNVAKDIGLELGRLTERNLRVVSGTKQDLFKVNPRDGVLFVNQRIDREELCGKTAPCITNLKAVVENPLEMHQVIIEILDVNDNSPKFPEENYTLEVLESATVGSRFQMEGAHDLDVGLNSLQSYKLNHNQYFRLETEEFGEEGKVPFLILQRPLDREQADQHWLLLTATDGGKPFKSGTMNITVSVSDINDNSPVCGKQKYTITVKENAPAGTYLLTVNASDSDEGLNGEIEYSLRSKLRGLSSEPFDLDSKTGKLTVTGGLDYEEKQVYELKVLAADKGLVSLSTHCNVIVRVEDVNDNHPEIEITSLSSRIPEDAPPGTVVALMGVTDLDSGVNGQVVCSVPNHLPFDLKPSPDGQSYSLVTKDYLDKEATPMYDITITAKDLGSPALSSTKVIQVDVMDINDNSPLFTQSPYTFYVFENNKAGMPIFSVSASDADGGQIRTLRSLTETDEAEQKLLILVKDNGNVSLSATATVIVKVVEPKEAFAASDVKSATKDDDESNVTFYLMITLASVSALFIISIIVLIAMQCSKSTDYTSKYLQETNYDGTLCHSIQYRSGDKRYMLVGPRMSIGSTIVPGSHANTLVLPDRRRASTEVDSSPTSKSHKTLKSVCQKVMFFAMHLFALDRYTGQIRTLRSFTETDEAEHKLLILVKDNGNVSLSATATVIVKVVEPKEAFAASDVKSATKDDDESNVTFYLMITLASVSALFIISIIVLIAMQCSKSTDYTSKYLQETNYDGTLCHSIQYRSGDKRYMLVGPRMSIGSTIVPGSHANTLVLPDRRRASTEIIPAVGETDEAEHKLLILVKDNGNVSLSATATVIVKVVEPKEAFAASDVKSATKDDDESNVTFYLMITLASVSALFIISIIVLIAMQCSKSTDYTSKYLQETNYDGTLCHSIQYRSGDKRYMLVGPRMSIGSTIVPGSHANTLVLPDRRRASTEPKVQSGDWRYSASLRAGGVMQSSVHMEESSVMQGAQGVLVQNWPTASSAADPEGGEVSPPMGAGVDSNSWHFRYGPGGPGAPPQHLKPGEVPPEAFIIPGSPAIISIRQNQGGEDDKSDFITFGKKEEAKKKKKKKKEKKDKKDKGKDDGDE